MKTVKYAADTLNVGLQKKLEKGTIHKDERGSEESQMMVWYTRAKVFVPRCENANHQQKMKRECIFIGKIYLLVVGKFFLENTKKCTGY